MRVFFLILLNPGLFSICLSQAKPLQYIDTTKNDIIYILKKVNENVSSIHSGTYKLHDTYTMINVGEDTTVRKESISSYYFKIDSKDSSIGYDFAYFNPNQEKIFNGEYLYDNVYKTLTVTDMRKSAGQVGQLRSSISFLPFMCEANQMMQNYKTHNNPVTLIGDELVDGQKCFKIQLGNTTDPSYVQYCISAISYLPVKSTVILTHINNKAKRIQTFNNWITDIQINPGISDSQFSKSALSVYNKEVAFTDTKNEPTQLLPLGSSAPDWELPTLNNKNIKLSNLAGKIVIMDFWYKACVPCQQQMIDLETLYARYDKNKVVFVGINTIDDPIKGKLKLFLENRKITMPTVYNGKQIEPLYHAYSSPVLYVIDKNGKIVYTQDGFSEAMIDKVTKIIKQNL